MKNFFHKYILLFGPVLSLVLIVLDRLTKELAVLKLHLHMTLTTGKLVFVIT